MIYIRNERKVKFGVFPEPSPKFDHKSVYISTGPKLLIV